MTISLYIDDETKNKAMKKAKQDKFSLSAVVRVLLTDYAVGNIVIGSRMATHYDISEVSVDESTQKKMDNVITKWRNKKK